MNRLLLSTLVALSLAACFAGRSVTVQTESNNGGGGGNGGNGGGGGGSSSSSGGGGSGQPDVIFGPSGATTLLVDNEWADAPQTGTPSYTFFSTMLGNAGVAFDTFINPDSGPDGMPTAVQMNAYDTVIWFSGAAYGSATPSLSANQETQLTNWLDQGGKALLLYTVNLVYDRGVGTWSGPETDALLANYLGVVGDAADLTSDVNGGLDDSTYVVTGAPGQLFAADKWTVASDNPIDDYADGVNVSAGTDILATVQADPDGAGSDILNVPAVIGRKNVGAKGSSIVVYAGITAEDLEAGLIGVASPQTFVNGTLTYVGFVGL
jgi:hypothetical protein